MFFHMVLGATCELLPASGSKGYMSRNAFNNVPNIFETGCGQGMEE